MKNIQKLLIGSSALMLLFLMVQFVFPSMASAGVLGCSQYSYKQCVSNISYWYDSCGSIQAVAQDCNKTNQICSNNQCINKATTVSAQTNYNNNPQTYIQNYRTACYSSNVTWYDSNAQVQGIYQNCADNNSCTVNNCKDNACTSVLKCDGSTCAVNSADYIAYCSLVVQTNTQATTQNTTNTTTTTNATNNTQITGSSFQSPSGSLIISLFVKKDSETMQWSKYLNASNNEKLSFVITVKNISNSQVDNASISANFTNAISYTGNLKIDDVTSVGNITSGIEMGTLPPNTSKAISFSGTVQAETAQAISVLARVSSGSMYDTDYLTVNVLAPGSSLTAAVSVNPFVDFVKKWYLWGIIILVLLILFIIIFRRLSASV